MGVSQLLLQVQLPLVEACHLSTCSESLDSDFMQGLARVVSYARATQGSSSGQLIVGCPDGERVQQIVGGLLAVLKVKGEDLSNDLQAMPTNDCTWVVTITSKKA